MLGLVMAFISPGKDIVHRALADAEDVDGVETIFSSDSWRRYGIALFRA